MGLAELARSERGKALAGLALLVVVIGAWRSGALPAPLAAAVADMANSGPSQRDIDMQTQNYYEVLMDVGYQQWTRGRLAAFVSRRLKGGERTERGGNWVPLPSSDLVITDEGSFLGYELKPSYETVYMGVPVKTNRWQMRDREVEQAKPPRTFRIALVGSSNDMGYGVAEGASYADLLEERLNRELVGDAYDRFEVLNFSVGGYQLLHRLYVADTKVPAFDPDLILIVATMHDLRWSAYELLVKRLQQGLDLHYDFLEQLAAEAGAERGQSALRLRQRIRPHREELVRRVFEAMRGIGEREGVPVVLGNFRLRVDPIHPEMIRQTELAREAGLPVLEVFDAYEGHSDSEMYLTPTDSHPTAKAHALLAEELYEDMLADGTVRALLLGQAERQPEERHAR